MLEPCDFYKDVTLKDDKPDLKIKWNVDAFISPNCTTGFIVQHMIIQSNISLVKNSDYWESWHIKEGVLENERDDYDDIWSPIPPFLILPCEAQILESADGIITFSSQVYWIPDTSIEYKAIETWEPVVGSPANELPMTYTFGHDVSKYFVFNRIHEWNYKEELLKKKGGDKPEIDNNDDEEEEIWCWTLEKGKFKVPISERYGSLLIESYDEVSFPLTLPMNASY